jgi:hypothetical protein
MREDGRNVPRTFNHGDDDSGEKGNEAEDEVDDGEVEDDDDDDDEDDDDDDEDGDDNDGHREGIDIGEAINSRMSCTAIRHAACSSRSLAWWVSLSVLLPMTTLLSIFMLLSSCSCSFQRARASARWMRETTASSPSSGHSTSPGEEMSDDNASMKLRTMT